MFIVMHQNTEANSLCMYPSRQIYLHSTFHTQSASQITQAKAQERIKTIKAGTELHIE